MGAFSHHSYPKVTRLFEYRFTLCRMCLKADKYEEELYMYTKRYGLRNVIYVTSLKMRISLVVAGLIVIGQQQSTG